MAFRQEHIRSREHKTSDRNTQISALIDYIIEFFDALELTVGVPHDSQHEPVWLEQGSDVESHPFTVQGYKNF